MRFWHRNIESVHAFYINGLFRALFMAMTSIFVPLFVYSLGLKLYGGMKEGLLLVVAYFVVQRILVTVIVFPLSKMIEVMGFRKSITISALFLIAYTVSLLWAEHNIAWIWISAVCMGFNIPLYWISRDSALSQDIPGNKMGRKIAFIDTMDNIASLTGPFVGGAIIAFAGYSTLFIVALAVLGLSILPLWWMPPHKHRNGVSLAGFWYFLTNGRYLHQAVANFGSAMNDYGSGVIWPLVLFFQGIKDKSLGAVYSIATIVTIAVQYLSGGWFDRLRAKKGYEDEGAFGFAALGVTASWILRMLAIGINRVIMVDMGRQLFSTMYANFYSDYMHLGGKRMGSIAFWVYMEVVYSFGALFIFGVLAVGIYFDIWKELTLITIALWSLATIVMARESNLK